MLCVSKIWPVSSQFARWLLLFHCCIRGRVSAEKRTQRERAESHSLRTGRQRERAPDGRRSEPAFAVAGRRQAGRSTQSSAQRRQRKRQMLIINII